MNIPGIEYLPDASVDHSLDAIIRALLTCCFTKPEDEVFKTRRYFAEPYPHRWVVRNQPGEIVAHIGVHEKSMLAGSGMYAIAGIAEVCVHPDFRGRGLVRDMLRTIHDWLRTRDIPFSVLMGDPRVYRSSGYRSVRNLFCDGETKGERRHCDSAMVYSLQNVPWPDEEAYVPGPSF